MSERKPSEFIRALALTEAESTQGGRARLLAAYGHPEISIVHIERYLDAEHDRRAAFEREVLERVGKLEQPECRVHDLAGGTSGAVVIPAVVTITTPDEWRAYHGDYPPPPQELTDPQPMVTLYEPEANEPEPERGKE